MISNRTYNLYTSYIQDNRNAHISILSYPRPSITLKIAQLVNNDWECARHVFMRVLTHRHAIFVHPLEVWVSVDAGAENCVKVEAISRPTFLADRAARRQQLGRSAPGASLDELISRDVGATRLAPSLLSPMLEDL